MTISDNNVLEPPVGETVGGDDNEENKEETGGGEDTGNDGTSGSDGEESGGGNETDSPETGGGGETGGDDSETPPDVEAPETEPDYSGEIIERLDSVVSALGDSPDYDSLADSFRALADVVTKQTETLETLSVSSVPVSGYRDYSYPVHVEYRIYPTALGSETGVSNDYDTPEDFESGYAFMADSVAQGNLAYFHIRYITDVTGTTVYDGTAAPEEPEEPEEPDTFRDDLLASLECISEDLSVLKEDFQSVSVNDLGYQEQALEFQEQYLELQRENVQLHYHFVACSLLIAFVLMITLGYTVAHGFLQRMKVG